MSKVIFMFAFLLPSLVLADGYGRSEVHTCGRVFARNPIQAFMFKGVEPPTPVLHPRILALVGLVKADKAREAFVEIKRMNHIFLEAKLGRLDSKKIIRLTEADKVMLDQQLRSLIPEMTIARAGHLLAFFERADIRITNETAQALNARLAILFSEGGSLQKHEATAAKRIADGLWRTRIPATEPMIKAMMEYFGAKAQDMNLGVFEIRNIMRYVASNTKDASFSFLVGMEKSFQSYLRNNQALVADVANKQWRLVHQVFRLFFVLRRAMYIETVELWEKYEPILEAGAMQGRNSQQLLESVETTSVFMAALKNRRQGNDDSLTGKDLFERFGEEALDGYRRGDDGIEVYEGLNPEFY